MAWGLKDDLGVDVDGAFISLILPPVSLYVADRGARGERAQGAGGCTSAAQGVSGGQGKGCCSCRFDRVYAWFYTTAIAHICLLLICHAPLVANCKCAISVGTATCFLSAAYSMSPVIAGAVVQQARACMCEPQRVIVGWVWPSRVSNQPHTRCRSQAHSRCCIRLCEAAGVHVCGGVLLMCMCVVVCCTLHHACVCSKNFAGGVGEHHASVRAICQSFCHEELGSRSRGCEHGCGIGRDAMVRARRDRSL